jgi:predicted nucleotidyltransferase
MQKNNFFIKILKKLDELQILSDLILVGSWCLEIYRYKYDNNPQIPILKTLDIDFLIPRKIISQKVDLANELKKLGFIEEHSCLSNKSKFCSPEYALEFLTSRVGRESNKGKLIKNLNIIAEPLRFMNLAEENSIKINYEDIEVNVPDPVIFVIHKLLIIDRRKIESKKRKDIDTVIQLGNFLFKEKKNIEHFNESLANIPKKWKKEVFSSIKKYCPEFVYLQQTIAI